MPDVSHPLIFAHRGASAATPGNTLAAFAAAVAQDADGIEMDVRRTADEVLVLHHDPTLADGTHLIELTLDEIRRRHPDVPTLDEMLAVSGDLLLNLEIKNRSSEPDFDADRSVSDAVVAWVQHHRIQRRVLVTSFDAETARRVGEVDREVATGLLTGRTVDLPATISKVVEGGHRWMIPHHSALDNDPHRAVQLAHDQGLQVMVWTLDDPARMVAMAAAGIDGVITNDPALANAALA